LEVIVTGNETGVNIATEREAIAVIVDVLRASTTIPTAMAKGLEEVWVVKEVEECFSAQKTIGGFIMGERDCRKLPGFSYGNSPVEMSSVQALPDKRAIFTSSTGAKRVLEVSKGAKYLLIGAIINAKTVAQRIKALSKKEREKITTVIIPAYTEGSITTQGGNLTEDQIGGVIIARECQKAGLKISAEVQKEIAALEELLKTNTIEELLRETAHGKKLLKLGFDADISFSSKLNSCNIVPVAEQRDIQEINERIKMVCFKKSNNLTVRIEKAQG